jgi:hypothetical protein
MPHSSSASGLRNDVSKYSNLSSGHLEAIEIKDLGIRVQRVQWHRWTRAEKVNDFNGVQVSSVSTPIGGSPPLDTAVTPRRVCLGWSAIQQSEATFSNLVNQVGGSRQRLRLLNPKPEPSWVHPDAARLPDQLDLDQRSAGGGQVLNRKSASAVAGWRPDLAHTPRTYREM